MNRWLVLVLVALASAQWSPPLVQYTSDLDKNWDRLTQIPLDAGNFNHTPTGMSWGPNWANAVWDGTIYNPSLMTKEAFSAAICPSVDTIRGLKQVWDQLVSENKPPFQNPRAPTRAEVDNWHAIGINHLRKLIGYTNKAEPDTCLHLRALWGEQRMMTDQWDADYPGTIDSAFGPCAKPTTNAHCGASFVGSAADQQPYWPAPVPSPFVSCPNENTAGSEGRGSGPKNNIVWSVRWSRSICNFLYAEGFWGGHVGPFFHRQKFGFSFWPLGSNDTERLKMNAVFRGKWAGVLSPNLYCKPGTDGCDPNNTGPNLSAPPPPPPPTGLSCSALQWDPQRFLPEAQNEKWTIACDVQYSQASYVSTASGCWKDYPCGNFLAMFTMTGSDEGLSDGFTSVVRKISGSTPFQAGIFMRGRSTLTDNGVIDTYVYLVWRQSYFQFGAISRNVTLAAGKFYHQYYGNDPRLGIQMPSANETHCTFTFQLNNGTTYPLGTLAIPCDGTNKLRTGGAYGFIANTVSAKFWGFGVASATRVSLVLNPCKSDTEIRDTVAKVLNIDPQQIQDYEAVCTTKRQGAQPVSFVLLGSDMMPAQSMAQILAVTLPSQLPVVPGSVVFTPVADAAFPFGPAVAAGGGGGLSGGAIAGIVVGSTVGFLLVAGAAVVALKSSGDGGDGGDSESGAMAEMHEPAAEQKEKKRDGVPVMNVESHVRRQQAGEMTSVTGRSGQK